MHANELIDQAPEQLRPALRFGARFVEASARDRIAGMAAEIAFWSLVSLPALLIAALATGTLVLDQDGGQVRDELVEAVLDLSHLALTPEAIDRFVEPLLIAVLDSSSAGVVSFAFLTAVWTASRAIRVILTTLALTANREDLRPAWKTRLLGIAFTLAGLVIGAVLTPLLIAGPGFGQTLEGWLGRDDLGLARVWSAVYWPATVVLAVAVIALLFHLGVPGRTRWRHNLPGAALTTLVWIAGSGGLRVYATWGLGTDGGVYGPLAGPIVLLLWLWLTGFAVLLGAELNAQLGAGDRKRGRPQPGDHPRHPDPAGPGPQEADEMSATSAAQRPASDPQQEDPQQTKNPPQADEALPPTEAERLVTRRSPPDAHP